MENDQQEQDGEKTQESIIIPLSSQEQVKKEKKDKIIEEFTMTSKDIKTLKDIQIKKDTDILIMKGHYKNWKQDTTSADKFSKSGQKFIPGKEPKVLVEAFVHYPKANKKDIQSADPLFIQGEVLNMTQQNNLTTLPFVKIIWSEDPTIKVGTVYSVKDKLAVIAYNPAHRSWHSERAGRPSMVGVVPIPPRFKMGWDAWHQFKYKIDKFSKETTVKDDLIFLVPNVVLITESKI